VGYNVVADNTGLSSFVVVVASQICEISEILQKFELMQFKVIDLGANRKRICNFQFAINNNNNTRKIFTVLSSCLKHFERSPWFTRWMQHGVRWPPTFRPSRSAWTISPACGLPVNYIHHHHFIITQPDSWYSFYHFTEGRRPSRHSWLAYRDGLPARTRSPIQVGLLTGPGVE